MAAGATAMRLLTTNLKTTDDMFKRKSIWLTAIALLLACLPAMSQTKKTFTLNDLLSGGDTFWNLRPKTLFTAWWGDCLVELDQDEVRLLTDERGRKTEPKALFHLSDVNKALGEGVVSDAVVRSLYYARFPEAGKPHVLLTTARETLLFDWQAGKMLRRIARKAGEARDLSTASYSEAYVRNWNLYVATADGREHQVTTDGSRELVYGRSVHRDEFGISKGTYWSPDGSKLAFYRMDQSMVTDFPLVDIAHRVAQPAPEKYPMAGMTSHKVTVGVYDVKAGTTVYLQAGDPTDRYFTNIAWAPDGRTIYMIELPRTQDKAELVAYDAATGERRAVLYTETHPKYVHPMHPIVFLPWDDGKFIYQSERDGYNHLYLFDVKGRELKQLTSGSFVVTDLVGFNEKTRSVIIRSTEASPLRYNYYAVSLKNGRRTLLDGGTGVHNATLSASGAYLCDRWSSPDVVLKTDLVSTAKATQLNLVTSADPWEGYAVPEVTCGSIKAADDSTDLYYRLVKPVDFDPTKKYPTVVYVYGGPGLRNVDESRHYMMRGWEAYMAQKGYVIFVLDNRGSTDRGLAFENCTFRHLGDEEMKDQMRGVDFLRTLPYVDMDRLGVHGWSFGGFMTVNLMCSHPDVFKVGVAGGPVIDWKFYEVMYGERYMDTPQENPDGYASSSLLGKAKNLKGRLQIIVGYNDPVCVMQHSLSFLRACEDTGTQPDYFVYPGQEHNMMGRDMIHLHERITRYFEDYLK